MHALYSITRDDLLAWANTPDANHVLPQLVRRLILETGSGVETIDMPDGSGVSIGGFDGFVRVGSGTTFIPPGVSVWELSVNKGGDRKADADYRKRHDVPDGSSTSEVTYVELLCRPWTTYRSWALEKTAERRWREVRAHNVDWLVTWIERAPATRIWLAERLGRQIDGVMTGAEWWRCWSQATTPSLTPELVLARDVGAIQTLKTRLLQPGITTIGGPVGGDELLACVIASTTQLDGQVASRTLVVDDRSAWRRLVREPSPLILAISDPSFINDIGTDIHHTILAAVPHADDSDVVVEPINANLFNDLLIATDRAAAPDLGFLAHRSFVALRRRIGRKRELMRPPWAASAPSRVVRATLLLTTWDDRNQADRMVIEAVAGCSYDQAREHLLSLSSIDDPFVALTAGRWHVVSPVDAWLLLGRYLLADDIAAFVEQAMAVLSEIDPALSVPVAERWRAGIDGKVLAHSGQLRRGLASGLALLATYGNRMPGGTGSQGEQWASGCVQGLLQHANRDGTAALWSSLSALLPLLAEAAPRQFVEAVRDGATGPEPVLKKLFQDEPANDSFFHSSSPHTGLLWALESLAWSVDFFAIVVELLAALAWLDPGGRLSNRPLASLSNIFTPWHPDTSASQGERLQALDSIRPHWPTVAWKLMISLMPSTIGGVHFPTYEPSFRDWKTEESPVIISDYQAFIENVLERLISDVGSDSDRWQALLGVYSSVPPAQREAIRQKLAALDLPTLSPRDRRTLWETARKLVAKHREYADAHWALPEDELNSLESSLGAIAPTHLADKNAWLFSSNWLDLGDFTRGDDHDAYEAELASRRAVAITEIGVASGLSGILTFACETTGQPQLVGPALADGFGDEYLDAMLTLVGGSTNEDRLARSYLWHLCRKRGLSWAVQVISNRPSLTALQRALLVLYCNDFEHTLGVAQRLGDEVEKQYWMNFNYFGLGSDFKDVLPVASGLTSVGRHAAALDCLALYARRSEGLTVEYAEAVAKAFEAFIASGETDKETGNLAQWDFDILFAALDTHVDSLGAKRVTRIEWYFLPALGYEPQTIFLHSRLARDADFFAEIVNLIYRPNAEVDGRVPPIADDDGTRERMATNAWNLLQSWHLPPGATAGAPFDTDECKRWIEAALANLTASDRIEVGEVHIGQVLAYTPAGDDGLWPAQGVMDLLESVKRQNIDDGILTEMYNRRGVTNRNPTEGGQQERILAAGHRQRANALAAQSPRTAAILFRLADKFEAEGLRHDAEAERWRSGLD